MDTNSAGSAGVRAVAVALREDQKVGIERAAIEAPGRVVHRLDPMHARRVAAGGHKGGVRLVARLLVQRQHDRHGFGRTFQCRWVAHERRERARHAGDPGPKGVCQLAGYLHARSGAGRAVEVKQN